MRVRIVLYLLMALFFALLSLHFFSEDAALLGGLTAAAAAWDVYRATRSILALRAAGGAGGGTEGNGE